MDGTTCRKSFVSPCNLDKTLLDPKIWATMTANMLDALFADSQSGKTLSDVAGRVHLVRNLGDTMITERWNSVADLYDLLQIFGIAHNDRIA